MSRDAPRPRLDVKTNDAPAGVDLETVLRIRIALRVHAANRVRHRPDEDGRMNVRSNGVTMRRGGLVRHLAWLNAAVVWHGESSVNVEMAEPEIVDRLQRKC
jgi:hypothetical protein